MSRLIIYNIQDWSKYFNTSRANDPLVHHGQHFGRTVHAMCNIQALVTDGILKMGELGDRDISEESLTSQYVPYLFAAMF